MKKEDFEKLKDICENEGFKVHLSDSDKEVALFCVSKKDEWEGVKFALNPKGKISRIEKITEDLVFLFGDFWYDKSVCKPSTESAYVEQLKKEAFERFGEIKEGDRFDLRSIGLLDKDYCIYNGISGYKYNKEDDALTFDGLRIYQQGKWVKRVKERIEVDPVGVDYLTWSGNVYFGFSFKGSKDVDKSKVGKFLANQLEKYLNDEIK